MRAVNLLPGDQRGAAKAIAPVASPTKAPAGGEGFGAYLVLGALALAVIAVSALVLTKNTINDRKAELAATEAKVQAVAAQAASLKPYADFKQMAEARVQTVSQLANGRFDWEQALRDMSRALPRDMRLSSFNGSVAGDGASATPGAMTTVVPTIQLAGCTGTHTNVAKLMARLRAIRGVTRVSLKNSDKVKADTAAAATATAPATTGGATAGSLCRGKTTSTFALTVYFERFGVPAVNAPAAAPGGPTGPTGPTGPAAPATSTTPTTPGTTPATTASNPATQGVSTP